MAGKVGSGLFSHWPRPNISVVGYALYLMINATSLWGGVFPFLPDEFHTNSVNFTFALCQSIGFGLTFLATTVAAYFYPKIVRRTMIMAGAIPIFLGAFSLIAALYLPSLKMAFVILAGLLLGVGGAGFAMAFQRYFASEDPDRGNLFLLLGTVLAPFAYLVIYMVPPAMTVYVVPLIFVPLCALAATLATNTIDFTKQEFQDVPREHPRVYQRVMKDYWKSAVAVGGLGFVSGTVHGTALSDMSMSGSINIAAMVGLFLAAFVLLLLWQMRSFKVDVRDLVLMAFPIAAIALALMPFLGSQGYLLLSSLVYMLFTPVTVVMLLQCAQITRNRGVNPLFVFGFFGSIVYLLQDFGFVFSFGVGMQAFDMAGTQFAISMCGLLVLSLSLYVLRGGILLSASDILHPDIVELTAMRPGVHHQAKGQGLIEAGRKTAGLLDAAQGVEAEEAPVEDAPVETGEGATLRDQAPKPRANVIDVSPVMEGTEGHYRDHISKCCRILQEEHRLTNRETEVMEMIVRGNSVAKIAELFVISENTVRTHSKHAYTKLGVHKRQDIIDMIEDMG